MRPRRIKISSDEHGDDGFEVEATEERSAREGFTGGNPLRHPLVALVFLGAASYALLAVALNAMVDTDRVREWLEPRASAVLNRPVSTGGARVALLPRPSIHVSDVRVDNLADFDGAALAFVERVRLDVRLLPLFVGRVNVHQVRLDGTRVNLVVDDTGRSNFGDLMPGGSESTGADGAPVALGVERVVVADATLAYFNGPAQRSFTISGAEASATLSPDGAAGWMAEVTAESDSMLVRLATVTDDILRLEGPRATLVARSNGSDRWITVEDGVLHLSGETMGLSGRVAGLGQARPSYDLQFTNDSLDAAVFATLLPARVRSERVPAFDGRLGVTFQVIAARAPGEPPRVQGSVSLDDFAVHVDGQIMVDHVNGTVGVTPDSVVLDSLTGDFADGPFELSGMVARDTRVVALRTHARPDLDALDRLGLVPDGATISGDAELRLSVAGRLDAPDSLDVAGTVRLEGLQAKHARLGVPIYVPAGELALAGRDVSWTDLTILVGQDRLVTSGRAVDLLGQSEDAARVPHLDATLSGPRLDLGAALPAKAGRPDVTYGQVAFAHVGGRQLDGRPAGALATDLGLRRPSRLPVHGGIELAVDTLDFHRYRLESVSARIELSDSLLSVSAPAFTVWGGQAAGSVAIGVGELADEPFSLTLTADGAGAEDMLSTLTPIGSSVSGRLALVIELAGSLDANLLPVGRDITGHATISIRDGRVRDTGPNLVVADFLGNEDWSDVSFDTWDSEIDFIARRLEVRESELSGEQGRVAFDGLVHLDGSHDLSVGLSIPPDRLEAVSLRRTGIGQSVLDHLSAAGSSLDLGLRMSGVLGAPQLEPDASNAVALAR